MHTETIKKSTQRIFEEIGSLDIVKNNFYLAGGTALALIYGHRKSIDLDFFTKKDFNNKELLKEIKKKFSVKILSQEDDTVHILIDNVKLSFFRYNYKILFPFIKYNEDINLASPVDIGCMKLDAISDRGLKKDFIDLFFILKDCKLIELLNYFEEKYKKSDYSFLHILKSLIYFDKANADPSPVMLKNANWRTIKNVIEKEVLKLVK